MEFPSMSKAILLQLEEERFDFRHKFSGVKFPALQLEGDFIPFKIHTRKRKAGFSQPTSLIDRNRPTDFLPTSRGFESRLNDGSFRVANFRLFIYGIGLDSHFRSGINRDVFAGDGLIQSEAQNTQIEEGCIQANLSDLFLFSFVFVVNPLPPSEVVEAHFPSDVGSRASLLHGEKLKEVFPSAGIGFKGQILALVSNVEPRLNPRRKFTITSLTRGRSTLRDFLGGANLAGLPGLRNGINPFAGGLLPELAGIIKVLNPPERGSSAGVETTHSVASVAKRLKKANSYRENLREPENPTQRTPNSWFKSMRGSSSVYQGLAGSVAQSVAENQVGGLNG